MTYPCPQCGHRGTQNLATLLHQCIREATDSDTVATLARQYPPPESFHWGWGLLLWIAVSALVRFVIGSWTILANLGAVLAFAIYIFVGVRYNRKVWVPAVNRWEQTFICRACGRVFRP